jgi:hypothetical protein
LVGTAGSVAVVAVGIVLGLVAGLWVPGVIVMIAGAAGLAVVLRQSSGGSGQRKRPRPDREPDVAPIARQDPDRAFFEALRDVPPSATPRRSGSGTARQGADGRESQW